MSTLRCWTYRFVVTLGLQIVFFPVLLFLSWAIDPAGGGILAKTLGALYLWGMPVLVALGVTKYSGTEADVSADIVGVPFPMFIYAVAIASLFTSLRPRTRAAQPKRMALTD